MFKAIDVSTSGLVAQRQRMNTVAENIANLNTTINEEGEIEPFRRRFVTFQKQATDPDSLKRGVGVNYEIQTDLDSPLRLEYDPGHPHANAEGIVSYPNINLVKEFVNALGASRAYEANIAALNSSKDIAEKSLEILR